MTQLFFDIADVKDRSHRVQIPPWLSEHFGLPPMPANVLQKVKTDDRTCFDQDRPKDAKVAMGWLGGAAHVLQLVLLLCEGD